MKGHKKVTILAKLRLAKKGRFDMKRKSVISGLNDSATFNTDVMIII